MRIIHTITSLERGGAQAVLVSILKEMAALGHQQLVVYAHGGPYCDIIKSIGIDIYQIKGIASFLDPVGCYRFYQFIKKTKPDCIHSLLWGSNLITRLVARLLSVPAVISLHNNLEQNGFIRNLLDRLVSFDDHHVIAVSSQVRDSFYAYQKSCAPLTIIENGVDYERLVQGKDRFCRESIGLLPGHFVVGCVGRFVPVKRYPLLLDAFALFLEQCAHARLVLVGMGPQEEYLREHAHKIGIDHALVWVINKPAYNYYSLFDCFVMTSDKEGISIALLEAMSFGIVPLVTSDTPIHPVVTNMHNGIVAYDKNATGIAQLLNDLSREQLLRKRLAIGAQQLVQSRFSKKRMVAAYLALFESRVQHFSREV